MADPKDVPITNKKSDTDATRLLETSRPVVSGTRGIISSGHYLTSMAGMRMMLIGGNAFDAVVASVLAASVVEPIASCSLAAETVFMIYDVDTGDIRSLSGQGTAPDLATIEFYRSRNLNEIPTGPGLQAPLSFTVPGAVHASLALLQKYGTKSFKEVIEPALQYAEAGIPHYQYMINALGAESTRQQFKLFPPGGSQIFYNQGNLPNEQMLLIQPGLANIFKIMIDAEVSQKGTRLEGVSAASDAFYKGDIARSISQASTDVGGILRYKDIAQYESSFEDPLSVSFRGYDICCQRTWSQAGVLLQALNILEQFDLKDMGHNSAEYIHTVTEAMKLCLSDRESYYGDPEFADVPILELLSKEYGVLRAGMIDQKKACPSLPEAGPVDNNILSETSGVLDLNNSEVADTNAIEGGTTHIAAIDSDGNIACATHSGGSFGKSVFFPELGCALSTRSEMFNLKEGHPNAVEPRKRPRTTLVNYLAVKSGIPVMSFGCPGGDHQAQANLQLILNTLVFGMDPQSAIESPRFASDSAPDSFYPHNVYPSQLSLEPGISDDIASSLSSLGHKVVRSDVCGMGATVTSRNLDTGILSTGADPRRTCYALSW